MNLISRFLADGFCRQWPAAAGLMAFGAVATIACGQPTSAMASRSAPATVWSAAERAGSFDLLSVDMVDPSHGWAVGEIGPRDSGGVVWTTTDSGRHWARLAAVAGVATSVHFVNQRTGWIAGYAGRIDRTDDGGVSWRAQRPEGAREVFNSISAVDDQRAWAVGANGLGARTVDGGATWMPMTLGVTADLWSVRFFTAERGWAVGTGGAIVTTRDGGATWTAARSGTTQTLFGLALAAPEIVLAVGDRGTVLRSDGGSVWMPSSTPVDAALYSVAGSGRVVWAVGARGAAIRSDDAGASWRTVAPITDETLRGLVLMDPRHGAAVGRKGYVQWLQGEE
jgi:photosystem II stability/assembly factor-like uncharacterized protein